MSDPRLANLAKILVLYSVRAKPGDRIAVACLGALVEGMPLVREVYREILIARATPHLLVHHHRIEEFANVFFALRNEDQLNYVDAQTLAVGDRFHGLIHILSQVNTRGLSKVDPAKPAARAHAYQPMWDLIDDRTAKGKCTWVLGCQPTTGYAQDAEMSLEEFEDFVYTACHANSPDPVAAWEQVGSSQQRIIDALDGIRNISVKGPHADMSFSVENRRFINCDGHHNMPDGEIFTGPVEDSVNGTFDSTFPAIAGGVDCGRVSLALERGLVVRAQAEKHADHLNALLETDAGAKRLGEFGVGTNDQIKVFTGNMLFDEKIGGTIHFAVGSGYAETGSVNKSGIHWDFLVDMREGGQILADGQLIYESGKFLIP